MAAIIVHEPVFSTQVESGDKLYFYEVGTTTDLTVYTDYALTAAATQPVVADSNGRFVPLYIDGTSNDPKMVLTDASDVEKWTVDRYPVDDLTTLTATVASNTSAISVLAGRMATAEADIDTLETESADYESRIADLEGESGLSLGDFASDSEGMTFPTGDIFKRGTGTLVGTGNYTQSGSVTFPTAFPSGNYLVMIIGSGATRGVFEITSKTVSGFNYAVDGLGYSVSGGTFYYMAWGN